MLRAPHPQFDRIQPDHPIARRCRIILCKLGVSAPSLQSAAAIALPRGIGLTRAHRA
jgi:hypothetical protein